MPRHCSICELPQTDKRLYTFVETDGCFADGVMVATGCSLGHRTLRLIDYGKVAATFVDTRERAKRADCTASTGADARRQVCAGRLKATGGRS